MSSSDSRPGASGLEGSAQTSGEVYPSPAPTSMREVFTVWWPLAASWLLMAMEMPAVGAVVARLQNPEIHLAAFGGIIYPGLLLIESPVIMLLAASTALSRDRRAYAFLRRVMTTLGVALTALHALVVFTPLYDVVVTRLIQAPPEIVGPARTGLIIALPWTWSIAYRRFNQGVLIRFSRSREVGVGTVMRLVATWAVLAAGFALDAVLRGGTGLRVSGVLVGCAAIVAGVVAEAAFIGYRVRPALGPGFHGVTEGEPLDLRGFARFYVPLAMTSLLTLAINPLGAAAMSRMPRALESLASWPVVFGLLFMLRSGGVAYKEVVVAILDRPAPLPALRRFTAALALGVGAATLLVAVTPIGTFWFGRISGLDDELAALAHVGLWFGVLFPILGVLQNRYVGELVHRRRTRGVTESVVLFGFVCAVLLVAGVLWGGAPGLYVGLGAFSVGSIAQLAWVRHRCRQA